MSKCDQRRARSVGRISSKYAVPGSGVRIVKPAWNSWCRSTNAQSRSKSASVHAGSIDEVSGHAVAVRARDVDAACRLVDGRVLAQRRRALRRSPPRARRRCRSPRAMRPPRLEQLGMPRHQIGAALHEDPLLPDAAAPQLARQLEAARRMVPEQIVGDEHVIADRREVAADGVDRPLADGARVQLPDRAERAAERAAARRLDQLGRPMRQARVLRPPRLDVMPRRQRHVVERQRADFALRSAPRRRRRRAAPGPARWPSGCPRAMRAQSAGSARSPSSSTTAVTAATRNGSGYAAAVWPPTTIGTSGEQRPHALGQRDDFVGLERVHGGDADQSRTRSPHRERRASDGSADRRA